MKLKDLREILANFSGADGELDIVTRDLELGTIVDFGATASVRWLGKDGEFTYADAGEKVFFLEQ